MTHVGRLTLTPATTAKKRRSGRAVRIGLLAGAVAAVLVVGAATLMSGGSSRHNRPQARSQTGVQACVALWNAPSNSRPRALLSRAALGSSVAPAVGSRVLITRYAGPPLEDVGVGESGVNASRGQCLIAHASNLLFLYSRGAWHQVGYSPGLAFAGIPQRAARSANATLTLQPPGERAASDAGTIRLTR